MLTVNALPVPRKSGWSLLRIDRTASEYCESGYKDDESLVIKAAGGKTATRASDKPEVPTNKEDYTLSAETTVDITFVSPEWISVTTNNGDHEPCEPRGGRSFTNKTVNSLDDLDRPVSLTDLLPKGSEEAYDAALKSVKGNARKMSEQCGIPPQQQTEAKGDWSITRARGKWVPMAFEDINYDCMIEAEMKVKLPVAITGPDGLPFAWKAVREKVPTAVDAIASPTEEAVVVVLPSELRVYSIKGNTLGDMLSAIPISPSERIIMTQWATGKNVARWTSDLAKITER